jgi:hypothetical protein
MLWVSAFSYLAALLVLHLLVPRIEVSDRKDDDSAPVLAH